MACRCGNAETQIFTLIDKVNIDSASFNATQLADYYLLDQGGSLNAVAKSAAGVDFIAMQNTINSTIVSTVTVSPLEPYQQSMLQQFVGVLLQAWVSLWHVVSQCFNFTMYLRLSVISNVPNHVLHDF